MPMCRQIFTLDIAQNMLRAICVLCLLWPASLFSAAFGKQHQPSANRPSPTQVSAAARIISKVTLKRIITRKRAGTDSNYRLTFDSDAAINHHGYNVTKDTCLRRVRDLCRPATVFNLH